MTNADGSAAMNEDGTPKMVNKLREGAVVKVDDATVKLIAHSRNIITPTKMGMQK